jgi:hypothetical protein
MIVHPHTADESDLRSIWKEVFKDTDEFVDSFFGRRYSADSTLVYREGGEIASMIFFPRYEFKVDDARYGLGYICGAATLTQFRSRGIMGQLLEASHEVMRDRGDLFAALIPASDSLYEYYRRYGYQELFFRSKFRISREEIATNASFSLRQADDPGLIYGLYLKGVAGLSSVVIQSRETFGALFLEFRLSGGDILVSSDRRVYCFARVAGPTLLMREMFTDNSDGTVYNELAAALFEYYPQVSVVEIETPADFAWAGSESFRTGMGRGLNDDAVMLMQNVTGAYMKFMLED